MELAAQLSLRSTSTNEGREFTPIPHDKKDSERLTPEMAQAIALDKAFDTINGDQLYTDSDEGDPVQRPSNNSQAAQRKVANFRFFEEVPTLSSIAKRREAQRFKIDSHLYESPIR